MTELSFVEHHQGWAEIVMNRPERRNSLVPALAEEITSHLQSLEEQAGVESIILRGNEGYFCSGIDLKALQDPDTPRGTGNEMREMHLALYHCRKPVIAALEKFAINAGIQCKMELQS